MSGIKAEYISHMGDDLMVVNAARVSFDKESKWEDAPCGCQGGQYCDGSCCFPKETLSASDAKLIAYLARHNHWTPFANPQITLRETVPIFVARQRFKHMVGFNYNEVSRRYVDGAPEFFVPEVWRSRPEGSVKQGSGGEHGKTGYWRNVYAEHIRHAEELYGYMVAEGVAPEQARMILPQSMMTSYYVTGSLAAFARFYRQRSDSHAQIEIQDLARQVGEIISPLFPGSWKALTE